MLGYNFMNAFNIIILETGQGYQKRSSQEQDK